MACSLWLCHSVRKDFTGFAMAAFIAWKLTVTIAIIITKMAANANNDQLSVIR